MRISDWSSYVCSSDLSIAARYLRVTKSAPSLEHSQRIPRLGSASNEQGASNDWSCIFHFPPPSAIVAPLQASSPKACAARSCRSSCVVMPEKMPSILAAAFSWRERHTVVEGKRMSERVELGGRRNIIKYKTTNPN